MTGNIYELDYMRTKVSMLVLDLFYESHNETNYGNITIYTQLFIFLSLKVLVIRQEIIYIHTRSKVSIFFSTETR